MRNNYSSKKIKQGSKGLTPNKQKRRPGGGDPSPVKKFKVDKGNKNG